MYGGVHRWSIFGAWGFDTTLLSVALGLLLLCEGLWLCTSPKYNTVMNHHAISYVDMTLYFVRGCSMLGSWDLLMVTLLLSDMQ
jgi:uncharacterized protein YjeT (DUF2065 family)